MEIQIPDIKTAKINNLSLKKFLTTPAIFENKKISEIDKILQSKGGPEGKRAYPFELEPLNRLRLERIMYTYPSINLSFLEKSIQLDFKKNNLEFSFKVPRFGIFPFFEKKNKDFRFTIDASRERGGNYLIDVYFQDNFPEIFQKELIKSLEYNKINQPYKSGFHFTFEIPREKHSFPNNVKTHKLIYNSAFITEFHALINDSKVNGNINNALKFFKKEEIYLISERKKEDWYIKRNPPNPSIENGDPLILGLFENKKPFLIDIFDATDLEKYVKDIYADGQN